MKHFVQYHNSQEMGELNLARGPHIYTNKSVRNLSSNAVWLVVGSGTSPKQYALASAFRVARTSSDCFDHPDFKNAAYGDGHVFSPPVSLNKLLWFDAFRHSLGNFSLGLTEIREEIYIEGLRQAAGRYAI